MKYDFVFVVLVYRNFNDLIDFINSLINIKGTYRIIIVNSYYDDKSKNTIKDIANRYNCDFINVENKGYGYGNNIGIKYAMENYDFKYVVISNPDIIVKDLSIKNLENEKLDIVGPKIITSNNKNQNPMYYYKSSFSFWLLKNYTIKNLLILLYTSIAINKIIRRLLNVIIKEDRPIKVYALHGSFIIISKNALSKLYPLFDEKMFLFSEEIHLAELVKKNKMNMYYNPSFKVYHKEDGSMKYMNTKTLDILRNSLKIYFENWG